MKRNATLLFLSLVLVHLNGFSSFAQEAPSYKNRIGINALGLPAENLVLSYEHSFRKNGLWLGLEHRLNQLSDDKDQQVNSLALEYRYYFFAEDNLAEGLFAGVYSKYRWGEENTVSGSSIQHEYQAVFSGLNAGYRYNYKRLALSAFLGYGLPLWSTESTRPAGATHELNENFETDLRIGLTVGFGF
ncbi:hypothetical protein [Cyclobacterium salsum]|uniref:hypothetical protein n=1 Tax=Cyclobacterium salsum TaxID=2666329 RepID=UPI001391508A|nr:hypothetical protein [Cyclobacterium salsum]